MAAQEVRRGVKERITRVHQRKRQQLAGLVDNRSHLLPEEQMKLLHHLYTHIDSIVVNTHTPTAQSELESAIATSEHTRVVDQLWNRFSSDSNERKIEVCEIYVPDFVQKTGVGLSKEEEDSQDEATKEVESVDHPLTPPLVREVNAEYLKEKTEKIREVVSANTNLTTQQQQQLVDMLLKHLDRFSIAGENMSVTSTATHRIDTGTTPPFRERLRQYSPAVNEIIDAEVRKMVSMGVLQPSTSPYASNLLLVRKQDASSAGGVKNRVCASFVQLNTKTVKDSYPLPNIQSIFDKVGRSAWFTTMDLLNGFWQVKIDPADRHKTAVITPRGLFEFVLMAFGLCNAPATFQRLMDTVIPPDAREFIETYIDDLLTHSKTFDEHVQHLDKLLALLAKHNLVVKLSKCKFAQKEVKFLGHILSQNQLKPNPEAVTAIMAWTKPADNVNKKKALRGFLGMIGWFRKFIPGFSTKAQPLFELLKDDVKWEWGAAQQSAFTELRDCMIKQPVLAIADPNKPYVMETDASDVGLGAILMQEDENKQLHPIAFASRSLNSAERNYSPTDREALAIVWSLEHFNTYCEGHKYTALTDHAALRYLFNNKDKTARMHRMVARLSPYELALYYKPGPQNHAADLLSRASQYMELGVSAVVTSKSKRQQYHKSLSQQEYEVEKIVGRRALDDGSDQHEYEVKWKGYAESENTWERLSALQNAMKLVVEYELERQKHEVGEATLSLPEYYCPQCQHSCDGPLQLAVHQHHLHGIPVPDPEEIDINVGDRSVLATAQASDQSLRFIYESFDKNSDGRVLNKAEKQALVSHEFVRDADGVLYCVDVPRLRSRIQKRLQLKVVLPESQRKHVITSVHEGPLNGHPGIVRTFDKLVHYVWWPGMLSDIVAYVTACAGCQQAKGQQKKVPSQPVQLAKRPWGQLGIDVVGPLPATDSQNVYIVTVMDHFTRYAEAWAVEEVNAASIADEFIKRIVCRYGLPEVLISDRGSVFVSELARSVYAALRITRHRTTAWHPQSNGVIERFHKTLKTMLKIWIREVGKQWDQLLPYALFAYNTAYHTGVEETPYFLCHGHNPRQPIDTELMAVGEEYDSIQEYARETVSKLRVTYARVTEILSEINMDRQQNSASTSVYVPGDSVWLYKPNIATGTSSKLTVRWHGPYDVLERVSSTTYRVHKEGKEQLVNVHRLQRATSGVAPTHGIDEEEDTEREEISAMDVTQQPLPHLHLYDPDVEPCKTKTAVDRCNGQQAAVCMEAAINVKW